MLTAINAVSIVQQHVYPPATARDACEGTQASQVAMSDLLLATNNQICSKGKKETQFFIFAFKGILIFPKNHKAEFRLSTVLFTLKKQASSSKVTPMPGKHRQANDISKNYKNRMPKSKHK